MADSTLNIRDEDNGRIRTLKLKDNGDGTYSFSESSTLTSGELHLGEIGGKLTTVSVEFTRPNDTTPYSIGDIVSDSTSASTLLSFANIIRVDAGSGYIVSARLSTDKKSITPRFRVHLFNTSDPTRSVDNANHQEKYADMTKRLGYFDLPAMTTGADTANSDMSRSIDVTLRIPITSAVNSRIIYVLLETLDAFTPAAQEKFTLTLSVDNN